MRYQDEDDDLTAMPVDEDYVPTEADLAEQSPGRTVFNNIGKPIAPLLVLGIVAMGIGSIVAVLLGDEAGALIGGALSLTGIICAVVGVARLGDAVQYLAMREHDREHAGD